MLECRHTPAPLVVVGEGAAVVEDVGARIGVVDLDETLGRGERQRAQQHCVDHREDRQVGAHADGQRGDGRGGKATRLRQPAQRVADVLTHGIDQAQPERRTAVLADGIEAAKLQPRLAASLRGGHAATFEVRGTRIEMACEFVGHLPFEPPAPTERGRQ